ncbi:MAG: Ig-like domain-containing protein [Oscillospiraceae bacterium]|nr:Ig-like domain-containing protein [Oscillospiraceae bacterium]
MKQMAKNVRKIGALALALVMVLGLLPGVGLIPALAITKPEDYGLGNLLRGFDSLSGESLLTVNLKRPMFKSDTYQVLGEEYCHFQPTIAGSVHTTKGRTMTEFARGHGFEQGMSAKGELGRENLGKINMEQKIGVNLKRSLREASDAMFAESVQWQREAIYDIDFGSIPKNVIQEQLNPSFLEDLTDHAISPKTIFTRYGTHFLTEYTLGGWAEAGIFSTETESYSSVNTGGGLEGMLTLMFSSGKNAYTGTATYQSRAETYGGRGGLITSGSSADAVMNTINTWSSNFASAKAQDMEILTFHGDGNNRIGFEGIWELLPASHVDRYYELITEYINLSIERDIGFNDTFVYKSLGGTRNADVDDLSSVESYSTANAIIIDTPQKFANIGTSGFPTNGNYVLTRNISLSGISSFGLSASGVQFTGTFDGNGYEISGFKDEKEPTISNSPNAYVYAGLFPRVGAGGVIKNLSVTNSVIKYLSPGGSGNRINHNINYYAGIIAGSNFGTIENCHVRSSSVALYISRRQVAYIHSGGISGSNSGTIYACSFSSARAVGSGFPKISNTTASSGANASTASIYAGAFGARESVWSYAGGISGSCTGRISDCYALTGTQAAGAGDSGGGTQSFLFPGGIAGRLDGTIVRSFADGANTTYGNWTGGTRLECPGKIVGYNLGTMTQCFYISSNLPVGLGSSAGSTGVANFRVGTIVDTLRNTPNSRWEYTNDQYPTHIAYERNKPAFIVEYPNGRPTFMVGDIIDPDKLSDIMTVHFTPVSHTEPTEVITNDVQIFYNFSSETNSVIYFRYTKGAITYFGMLSVPTETHKIGMETPTGLSLDRTSATMRAGSSIQLIATLAPRLAEPGIEWSSSDESIADVGANGEVFAHAEGTVVITATTVNGISADCEVKVVTMPCDGNCTLEDIRKGECISEVPANDVWIPGIRKNEEGEEEVVAYINLTQEKLVGLEDADIKDVTNNGKAVKKATSVDTFNTALAKLLNKPSEIKIGDITFPKINARPKDGDAKAKLAVNYKVKAINDRPTGPAGGWVLTTKGTDNVNTRVEIGIADYSTGAKPGKTVSKWGKIADEGICVAPFDGSKVQKTVYYWKTAAEQGGTETAPIYTPGSKPKKVSATSLLKPMKAIAKGGKLKFKDGSFINGNPVSKGSHDVEANDLVWIGAGKKAATSPVRVTSN